MYSSNENNMVVLNDGVKFAPSGNSSVEMQLNEHKLTNAELIAQAFGLSSVVVSGKASTEEYMSAVRTAIIPVVEGYQAALNRSLLTEAEKAEGLYFALDTSEILKGDMVSRFNAYSTAVENGRYSRAGALAVWERLLRTFVPLHEGWLVWSDGTNSRRIKCRLSETPQLTEILPFLFSASFSLIADFPYWEDCAEHSLSVAASAGTVTVTNSCGLEVPFCVDIPSGGSQPLIYSRTADKRVSFAISPGSGCTVDTRECTVTLSDGTLANNLLTVDSEFFRQTWAEQKTGDICDCISLEYEKYFNGVGTFTAELPANTRFRDSLEVNSVLVLDSGDALIVKNIRTTLEKITLTGYDLNGLLCDRLTLTDAEDGYDTQKGATETIVKHFVTANLADCQLDPNRNLPRFGAAEDKARGDPEDSAMPRLQNVQELVTEICGAAGLGWRVSINGNAANDKPIFLFDVAEQVDRTADQSERNRVIFSAQMHNVSTVTREVGVTAAKNALFLDIGGTVVQYPQAEDGGGDSGRAVFAGYDRREEYCSLTTESLDKADYVPEAEQNISDRMNETDSLTIDAGNPLDYGRMYDVGTVVTVYDKARSLQLNSVISAATVRRSGTEYSVKLTLGESKPKLLDQYQKKSDATQKSIKKVQSPKDITAEKLQTSGAAFCAKTNSMGLVLCDLNGNQVGLLKLNESRAMSLVRGGGDIVLESSQSGFNFNVTGDIRLQLLNNSGVLLHSGGGGVIDIESTSGSCSIKLDTGGHINIISGSTTLSAQNDVLYFNGGLK